MRAAVRALSVLALCAALAAPAFAQPAPSLRGLRALEVWRDELPERIGRDELEVVVLSPDSRCRPPPLRGPLGLTADALDPVTGVLCRRLESFAAAPWPMPLRVHTAAVATRTPAGVVAALAPAPTRRYVALVHWEWAAAGRDVDWMFELALVDRSDGRWLWHGARIHNVSTLREFQERDLLHALQALLQHELARDLLSPGWWREQVPVPGARWVMPADLAAWRPEAGRAGLVVANTYAAVPASVESRLLKLWPADQAEVNDEAALRQGGRAQYSTVPRAQSTPLIAPATHAMLDLPAGRYRMSTGREPQDLALEPGTLTVLRIERGAFNATTLAPEPEAWWRGRLAEKRLRHAFLAEPAGTGPQPVVPFFQDGVR